MPVFHRPMNGKSCSETLGGGVLQGLNNMSLTRCGLHVSCSRVNMKSVQRAGHSLVVSGWEISKEDVVQLTFGPISALFPRSLKLITAHRGFSRRTRFLNQIPWRCNPQNWVSISARIKAGRVICRLRNETGGTAGRSESKRQSTSDPGFRKSC